LNTQLSCRCGCFFSEPQSFSLSQAVRCPTVTISGCHQLSECILIWGYIAYAEPLVPGEIIEKPKKPN